LPEWLDASPQIGIALKATAIDGEAYNLDTNVHKTWSYGLFGQGTYHFNQQWSATVGLRGTYEKKARDGSQISTLKLDTGPFGPDQFYDESLDVWNFSPMAVLSFAPTEDSSVFGKFARGFKSGGFNQQRVPEGAPTSFDDEQATDFELGVRTTWFDRMLTANATGFYTIFDDFQAQAFDGSALTVTNAGSLTSYGIEGDLFLVPHETIVIGASFGWNVAEYDKFKSSPCTAVQSFDHRLAQGNIFTPPEEPCKQDLSGRRLDNAPRWTTSLFTQFEHPISDFGVFEWPLLGKFRIEYNYRDFIYLTQDLDPNLTQSPIHLLNLRLTVSDDARRWEAALWSQNTLNDGYGVVGFDVPITSGYAVINAPPRTFGGTLRLFF
jgi:iron complex outermembrane receptor protein